MPISNFLLLGVGAPGSVEHFLTGGLSAGEEAADVLLQIEPTLELFVEGGEPRSGVSQFLLLGIGGHGSVQHFVGAGLGAGDPTVSSDQWVDLTPDLVNDPLRWSRGIFGAGPLDLLGRPGSLTGTLDNTDTNSTGTPYRYSPGHANVMEGFRHGAIVRLSLTHGALTRYVFRGRLKVIDPDPDLYGLQVVRFMATDWLADFASYDAGQLFLREEVRSDELLDDLLQSLPTQPVNIDIDMGLDEYEFAFDDLGGAIPKATEVAQDILQSERGYLYLRGDDTDGETLRFENRQARAGASPLTSFTPTYDLLHDRNTITVPSDLSHIFNDVEVLTVPREVDDELVVLVRLTAPVEVVPGNTERVFVDYQDPDQEAEKVGGKFDLGYQPLANTDWTANEDRDGGGADLTASISINAVFWGSRCMIELTNNHPSQVVYVRGPGGEDGLQVRGYGLYRYRPVSSRSTNADSIERFGARQLPNPLLMPYQESRNIGQGVADLIANVNGGLIKVPLQLSPDTFSSNDRIVQGITRDIGDPVLITEVATGLDMAMVFIHGLSQELGVDGLLRTSWTLCPGDVTDVFILDDPEHGVLDQNVLAYA